MVHPRVARDAAFALGRGVPALVALLAAAFWLAVAAPATAAEKPKAATDTPAIAAPASPQADVAPKASAVDGEDASSGDKTRRRARVRIETDPDMDFESFRNVME